MNRYDSTAQTPPEPIPQDQFSLSRVRPGLSRFSRTVRADLRVRSTAQVIEVQFSQHRIRESLAAAHEREPTENIAVYVLVALATIVFVGGTVVSTGSIVSGVIVATLLPTGYVLIATPKSNKLHRRKAILKLVHTPDGHLLLTLMTAPDHKIRPAASLPTTLYVSQVPVHAIRSGPIITLSAAPLCHQLSFTLTGSQSQRLRQLRITGSRQEIQWLYHHLEGWGQIPRKGSGRSQDKR